MSADLGEYARLYHCIPDDPKFATIYDDDHHFAAYCRLLMIADAQWSASAHLPATVRGASVRALADAGLIDLQAGGRYRIHGLDAERMRRQEHARKASNARWSAPGNAPGNAPSIAGAFGTGMPSKAEQSKADQSTAEQGAADPADTYWSLTGRYPQGRLLAWIDDLAETYGRDAVASTIAAVHHADPDVKSLLGRVKDVLAREARRLDAAERDAEKARVVELRRPTVLRRAPDTVTDEEAEAAAEAYLAEFGQKGVAS